MPIKSVPPGKRVLNTHVSRAEHEWLRRRSCEESMTMTMFLRTLMRREMEREASIAATKPAVAPSWRPSPAPRPI